MLFLSLLGLLYALLSDSLAAAGLFCSCLRWKHKPKITKISQRQFFILFWQFSALQWKFDAYSSDVDIVCRQPVCHYAAPLLGGIKKQTPQSHYFIPFHKPECNACKIYENLTTLSHDISSTPASSIVSSSGSIRSSSCERKHCQRCWSFGSVVVRASDLWSTGLEFDSRPCTAGLVLGGWPSVGG